MKKIEDGVMNGREEITGQRAGSGRPDRSYPAGPSPDVHQVEQTDEKDDIDGRTDQHPGRSFILLGDTPERPEGNTGTGQDQGQGDQDKDTLTGLPFPCQLPVQGRRKDPRHGKGGNSTVIDVFGNRIEGCQPTQVIVEIEKEEKNKGTRQQNQPVAYKKIDTGAYQV